MTSGISRTIFLHPIEMEFSTIAYLQMKNQVVQVPGVGAPMVLIHSLSMMG